MKKYFCMYINFPFSSNKFKLGTIASLVFIDNIFYWYFKRFRTELCIFTKFRSLNTFITRRHQYGQFWLSYKYWWITVVDERESGRIHTWSAIAKAPSPRMFPLYGAITPPCVTWHIKENVARKLRCVLIDCTLKGVSL